MRKILVSSIILFFIKSFAYGDILQDSKAWKFLSSIAEDAVSNFPKIPYLQSETEIGVLKFGKATYAGEIKKGKAHGYGVFKFANGTTYEGKFKRNMFHGNGVYKDENGNLIKGKWKYNKLRKSINNKTREVFQLNKAFGKSNYFEMRGDGELYNKWYEAKITKVNSQEIQFVKELDIFDTPTAFSKDYGDQDKINIIIDKKNAEIAMQNEMAAEVSSNLETEYTFTDKGLKDMKEEQKVVSANATAPNASNAHSGGMMSGGGC